MSCDPDSGSSAGIHHSHHQQHLQHLQLQQQRIAAALTMKPLLIAKEEPDCIDHVSESKSNLYDDGQSSSILKSSQQGDNNHVDMNSDNEASEPTQREREHQSLSHQLSASGIKLEAALLELNVGLNLISKPNNNNTMNDDNNNTNPNYNNATASNSTNNDNNNNNTSNNNNKDGNKAPRKLFECDVCNVRRNFPIFSRILFSINGIHPKNV